MRKVFHGYYPPADEEIEKLWSHGILVPDTNVLKHLFRFMPKQRAEVLAAFSSFGERLWLPYQVGKEFQQGWRSADTSNRNSYQKLKADLEKKRNEVESLVLAFNRYEAWAPRSSMHQIGKFFDGLSQEVDTAMKGLPENPDNVFLAVTKLFEGRVGEKPKDIDVRIKEAERRKREKIPPGYMDDGPGDYLIWAEIKEKAKAAKAPILFVTDDNKEDWWLKHSGKTIGPRPELRHEFFGETGEPFYAYAPDRFLSLLADRNKTKVSPETIDGMKRAAQSVDSSSELDSNSELLRDFLAMAERLGIKDGELLHLATQLGLAWRTLRGNSASNTSPNKHYVIDLMERARNLMGSYVAADAAPSIVTTKDHEWTLFMDMANKIAAD
ncbi:MAG: hypothetical protein EOS70_13805 [Mesorhizobium sp.]|uniref:PIN-like domain-containing protein n=1 Tax=Mesorhizobium sp. TaxID=1871066 RepID=UPI000FE96D8C|nr:PIN-like domain-containing protein [Mesorhizobium sp.]RWC34654.1 MAG: hypothetical protein EOS70_13805 [Mesorhizobium sp.]